MPVDRDRVLGITAVPVSTTDVPLNDGELWRAVPRQLGAMRVLGLAQCLIWPAIDCRSEG